MNASNLGPLKQLNTLSFEKENYPKDDLSARDIESINRSLADLKNGDIYECSSVEDMYNL